MPTARERKPTTIITDDDWLQKHFEWLIDNFPGQYVVVAEGEPFIGRDVTRLERQAQTKHPGCITTGMPIPHPKNLSSILPTHQTPASYFRKKAAGGGTGFRPTSGGAPHWVPR